MSDKYHKKIRKETRRLIGDIGERTREMFQEASALPVKQRLKLAFYLVIGKKEWKK